MSYDEKRELDFIKTILVLLAMGYGAYDLISDEDRRVDAVEWVILLATFFIRCDVLSTSTHDNWPLLKCATINTIITVLYAKTLEK